MTTDRFVLTPIGKVECAAMTVADVPSEGLPSDVVLDAAYLPAAQGVEVGDHLYVLAMFDKADPAQLSGSTGTPEEQGAFSIRSSSRPNLIGMTLAQVTAIDGARISFGWLDFANGSPVVDLKRYNWRWECVLAARRLDRRFIEHQVDRPALVEVLTRPAVNFHGERCQAVEMVAELGAALVHDHDVWLSDPELTYRVTGDGHLVDAVQGMTGSTLGNGRLSIRLEHKVETTVVLGGSRALTCRWHGGSWRIT